MPLTEEEKAQLEALTKKADEPEPSSSGSSRVENVNITIDLDNEDQVRRAVKAGYLPESYLEDDTPPEGDAPPEGEEPPRRKSRYD